MKHKNLLSRIKIDKEIFQLVILKLKKKYFSVIRLLFFKCRYWESNSILQDFFWWKNYKYFIGYLHNYNKVKPLHGMLRKTSAYVKSYDGQTKWMYLLIKNDSLL